MTALLVALLLTQVSDESPGDEPPKLNVISVEVNGWDMAYGSTAITFERALLPHLSIAGGLVAEEHEGATGPSVGDGSDISRYTGGIRALARWYPAGAAPFGLWLGPMAAALASGTSSGPVDSPGAGAGPDVQLYTGGLLFGFSGMLPFGAVLQVSGGIRGDWATVTWTSLDSSGTLVRTTNRSFAMSPIVYLGVGWAF